MNSNRAAAGLFFCCFVGEFVAPYGIRHTAVLGGSVLLLDLGPSQCSSYNIVMYTLMQLEKRKDKHLQSAFEYLS